MNILERKLLIDNTLHCHAVFPFDVKNRKNAAFLDAFLRLCKFRDFFYKFLRRPRHIDRFNDSFL